jgi:hypothetical protein
MNRYCEGGKLMKKLNGVVFVISLLLLGGIADGLCEGAPLSTVLWCIPLFLLMWLSGKIAE